MNQKLLIFVSFFFKAILNFSQPIYGWFESPVQNGPSTLYIGCGTEDDPATNVTTLTITIDTDGKQWEIKDTTWSTAGSYFFSGGLGTIEILEADLPTRLVFRLTRPSASPASGYGLVLIVPHIVILDLDDIRASAPIHVSVSATFEGPKPQEWVAYPNPSHGEVTLCSGTADESWEIAEVWDTFGNLILTLIQPINGAKLPPLPSGVYFLRVSSKRRKSVFKFTVQ